MANVVYIYDEDGYFIGSSEQSKASGNYTNLVPNFTFGCWNKFDDGKWVDEAIPSSATELEGMSVKVENQTNHEKELSALFVRYLDDEHKIYTDENIMYFIIKPLDDVKTERLTELEKITAKFEDNYNLDMYFYSSVNGWKFNGDRRSAGNIENKIKYFEMLSQDGTVPLTDYDNVERNVTKDQLTVMNAEIIANGQNLYNIKHKYVTQISECETTEDVRAIEFEFPMTDFSSTQAVNEDENS